MSTWADRRRRSPLLRRPDLLKSLLGYWLNHPSLSYLFSGLFIGPTSQHPRIDEARNDALHELEIAFRQIEPAQTPPWLVDRIFRNLLVDATGNTHRTEFCIDKLFTPDSAAGRRGLLEMRAFEMPPHWRMSIASRRCCAAWCRPSWQRPYEAAAEPLGHATARRFHAAALCLAGFHRRAGGPRFRRLPLPVRVVRTHFEFRFPRIGAIAQRGIELELPPGAGAVARAGRGAGRRRRGALRRQLGRAPAGQGRGG
jgi:uncharacterized protein (DUF2126 family)